MWTVAQVISLFGLIVQIAIALRASSTSRAPNSNSTGDSQASKQHGEQVEKSEQNCENEVPLNQEPQSSNEHMNQLILPQKKEFSFGRTRIPSFSMNSHEACFQSEVEAVETVTATEDFTFKSSFDLITETHRQGSFGVFQTSSNSNQNYTVGHSLHQQSHFSHKSSTQLNIHVQTNQNSRETSTPFFDTKSRKTNNNNNNNNNKSNNQIDQNNKLQCKQTSIISVPQKQEQFEERNDCLAQQRILQSEDQKEKQRDMNIKQKHWVSEKQQSNTSSNHLISTSLLNSSSTNSIPDSRKRHAPPLSQLSSDFADLNQDSDFEERSQKQKQPLTIRKIKDIIKKRKLNSEEDSPQQQQRQQHQQQQQQQQQQLQQQQKQQQQQLQKIGDLSKIHELAPNNQISLQKPIVAGLIGSNGLISHVTLKPQPTTTTTPAGPLIQSQPPHVPNFGGLFGNLQQSNSQFSQSKLLPHTMSKQSGAQ